MSFLLSYKVEYGRQSRDAVQTHINRHRIVSLVGAELLGGYILFHANIFHSTASGLMEDLPGETLVRFHGRTNEDTVTGMAGG